MWSKWLTLRYNFGLFDSLLLYRTQLCRELKYNVLYRWFYLWLG